MDQIRRQPIASTDLGARYGACLRGPRRQDNSKKEWGRPSTPEFGMKTQVPAGFVCAMGCGGLRFVVAVDVGELIDIYMRHRLGNKGDSLRIVTRSGIGRSGALCTCSNTGRQPPLAGKFPLQSKREGFEERKIRGFQVVNRKQDQLTSVFVIRHIGRQGWK